MDTTEPSWEENLIGYYDTLELFLEEVRRPTGGSFHTHFGLVAEPPEDYCFCRALFLSDLFPEQFRVMDRAIESLQRRIFEGLNPGSKGAILDVGCGTGGTLLNLSFKFPGAPLYGINLNAVQLEKAKDLLMGVPNVGLYRGNFNTFHFSRSFSLVYFIESAFHNPDKDLLCDRIREILEPGGEVRIVEFFLSSRMEKMFGNAERESSLFHYLSVESWEEKLAARGMEVYDFEDTSREVAGFLQFRMDPGEFQEQVIRRRVGPQGEAHPGEGHMNHIYEGYKRLGRLLRRGSMRYGILRVRLRRETRRESPSNP